MNEQLYENYAVLDAQIKELTKKKDEIKVSILEDMSVDKSPSMVTAVGKFTVSLLKTWTYPALVTEAEEEFKALKATQESNGNATFVEKPSLRFTQIKL